MTFFRFMILKDTKFTKVPIKAKPGEKSSPMPMVRKSVLNLWPNLIKRTTFRDYSRSIKMA
jgi:hypothetical protein